MSRIETAWLIVSLAAGVTAVVLLSGHVGHVGYLSDFVVRVSGMTFAVAVLIQERG